MQNKIFKILLFIGGIIVLLIFLIIYFFCFKNYYFFPKEYSGLEYLLQIFNLIFWSWILLWIYKWKKDRDYKIEDDFINNFDLLYFKSRKLLKEDNLYILNNKISYIYMINNFESLEIDDNFWTLKFILKNKKYDVSFFQKYWKVLENIEITESILDLYELINYLNIKKNIFINNNEIKNYVINKLSLFRNLNFIAALFITHLLYSKIAPTETSTLSDNSGFIINNKKMLKFIDNKNKEFSEVLNILK